MTSTFQRPKALQRGDTVAALSLSSGFVTQVMHRAQAAERQIQGTFGLNIIYAPNALRGEDYLYRNPQARADDLHWALENPEVQGLLSIIGGDDSVRLLPYLSLDTIAQNPKVFMGFSDSTVTLLQFLRAGVVSFYGPALLTDLAEHGGIRPYTAQGVRQALMTTGPVTFQPADNWTEQRVEWLDPSLQDTPRVFEPSAGWAWLQGNRATTGHLLGGCIEVLDMLNGTPGWPEPELWHGAILLLETSEDTPPPHQVGYWLRNFAAQGILTQAAGLVLARPKSYTAEMTKQLYGWVKKVLYEAGCEDMPVLANVDFGHTSPQLTLPLGAQTRLDPVTGHFELLESGVV